MQYEKHIAPHYSELPEPTHHSRALFHKRCLCTSLVHAQSISSVRSYSRCISLVSNLLFCLQSSFAEMWNIGPGLVKDLLLYTGGPSPLSWKHWFMVCCASANSLPPNKKYHCKCLGSNGTDRSAAMLHVQVFWDFAIIAIFWFHRSSAVNGEFTSDRFLIL